MIFLSIIALLLFVDLLFFVNDKYIVSFFGLLAIVVGAWYFLPEVAAFIAEYVRKPVVGYVAGFTAPEGKTMGHAGAIVSGSSGTAQAKKDALEAAGVKVGQTPSETAQLMRELLGR